jgi:dihydrofolate reductase
MRKLNASFFISIDGVVEAPETWHFPYFDDEMGAVVGGAIAATDAFLLGRRTYEEFAAFWPRQDPGQDPMAHAMNSMPKFVVSRSLGEPAWEHSTVLRGEAADEVSRLKQKPGGDIAITGSATLVRSLLEAGLIDELRLMVHPIVVGRGARLFDGGMDQTPLELAQSQTFGSGVLNLTYRLARE